MFPECNKDRFLINGLKRFESHILGRYEDTKKSYSGNIPYPLPHVKYGTLTTNHCTMKDKVRIEQMII